MSQARTITNEAVTLLPTIQADLRDIEVRLRHCVHSNLPVVPEVFLHTVDAGGKRVRPALVLLSAQLTGGISETTRVAATAVELVHLASLLHDDVVDDSSLRRQRLTANRVWGNKSAVLVADYAQAIAMRLLAERCPAETIIELTRTVVRMTEGELCQMHHEGSLEVSESTYLRMIGDKTASLLSFAAHLGAISAKATPEASAACRAFGEKVGLAFQIVDDLLDLSADEMTIGKPVGNDLHCGRLTLAPIHALAQGGTAAAAVRQLVCVPPGGRVDLSKLRSVLVEAGSWAYAKDRAKSLCLEAAGVLDLFPASPERDGLLGLADYVLTRTH